MNSGQDFDRWDEEIQRWTQQTKRNVYMLKVTDFQLPVWHIRSLEVFTLS